MSELNQLETEELFCPGDLEIEVNNGGGKWKASFPKERISQTPAMNLVYVGKYLLPEIILFEICHSFSCKLSIKYQVVLF